MLICLFCKLKTRPALPLLWTALTLSFSRPAHAAPLWHRLGSPDANTVAVAIDPQQPNMLYTASTHVVSRSTDHGQTWHPSFHAPSQASVVSLAVDPFEPGHVLVATNRGLYESSAGQPGWRPLLRGHIPTIVRFHPARRNVVLLGTQHGLLISQDGGRRWQPAGVGLEQRRVVHVAIMPEAPHRLYVVTDRGLFASAPDGLTWDRLFARGSSQQNEAAEEPAEESAEEPEAEESLRTVAIDPKYNVRLYLANSRALYRSDDAGRTWKPMSGVGLGSARITDLLALSRSPTVLYAATSQGVARCSSDETQWEILYAGLPAHDVRALAASAQTVFAATSQGLYALDLSELPPNPDQPPSAREVLDDFVNEPSMDQVRQRAIHYAEVDPTKIQRWRLQAALKALLPSVHVDYDHNRDTYLNGIGSTTNPSFDRIIRTDDPSKKLGLSVSWDLGDLIWNNDQTSIDTRSRLLVQLRDDILNDVTRTYFERRRLQVELLTDPPANPKIQLEKELRLQELTALIDGLTGGWFSQQLDLRGRLSR